MNKFRLLACLLCFGVAFSGGAMSEDGNTEEPISYESNETEAGENGTTYEENNFENSEPEDSEKFTNEESSEESENEGSLKESANEESSEESENEGSSEESASDEMSAGEDDSKNDAARKKNVSENPESENVESEDTEKSTDAVATDTNKKSKKKWSLWPFGKSNKKSDKKTDDAENAKSKKTKKSENSEKTADTSSTTDTSKKTQSKWKLWFSRKSKEKTENNPAEKAKKTEKNDEKIVSEKDSSNDSTAPRKIKETEKEDEKSVSEKDSSDDSTVSKSKKHRRSAETKTKSNTKKKRKKSQNIKFKIDLSDVSKNYTDASETDSDLAGEEFEDGSETDGFEDSDGRSEDFSEDFEDTPTERRKTSRISARKNGVNSAGKGNKRSPSPKTKSGNKNQTRKKRKNIKFNIDLSRFTPDEGENSSGDMMLSAGNMMMPATNTQLLQDQNLFAQPNQMMNLQAVPTQQTDQFANQNFAVQPDQMTNFQTVPMQTVPMQQLDQFANQNFDAASGQAMNFEVPMSQNSVEMSNFPQNHAESNINGGMNQANMMQTPSATVAPMMQPLDTTAPTNTMIVSNAMPAPMYAMPVPMYPSMAGMNNQLSVQSENGNSQPSFLESFLQNLNGQNSNEQNQMFQQPNGFPNEGQSHMHPYSDSDPARNRYNVEINQLNHRISSLEQYLMNNNGQPFSGSMSNADTIKGSRNLSDDEVAEEVIQYLRELEVLDESKFSQLSMKDIGICIRCRNRKEVTILDREKHMGICKSCAKDLINDALRGRFLGDGSMLNRSRYRSDSGIDLSDDLARDRLDRYGRTHERDSGSSLESELFGGSNGGVVGSLISAGVTQALMKKSSDQQQIQQAWNSNPNFGMGTNTFMSPQGLPMPGMSRISGVPGTMTQGMQAQGISQGITSQYGQAQGLNANGSVDGTLGAQMLLNAVGQLVPLNSLAGSAAPYGYKKDPATGALIPASSLEDGLAAAQLVAARIVAVQQTSAGVTAGAGNTTISTSSSAEGITAAQSVAAQQSSAEIVTGGTAEQMVLNAAGQLVPLSSLAGTGAPYGYVIDPQTGMLIPAKTPEEGTAVRGTAAGGTGFGGTAEQMVLNAAGQLVPLSSLAGTGAPYGYKIDPATGTLIPALSPEEGLSAAQPFTAQSATAQQSPTGVAAGAGGTGFGGTAVGGTGFGGTTEQMVLNAAGQLVPLSSLAGTGAPYGYVIDPQTGMLIPAKTPEEGIATAQQIMAESGQQISTQQDLMGNGTSSGQTQSWDSGTNNSEYGMTPDQTQQQYSGTDSYSGTAPSASGTNAYNWGKYGKIAAGVAAGGAILGSAIAGYKALKKSKNPDGTETNDETGSSANGNSKLKTAAKVVAGVAAGAAALGATYAAYKAIKKAKGKGSDSTGSSGGTSFSDNSSSDSSSARSQSDISLGQYSAEEVKQAKKTSDELTKKIKKANKNVEKAKKEVEEAEKKVRKKEEQLSTAKENKKAKAQNELNSAKEALERAQKTLEERQETLDNLQQQQASLKEKYGKEPGGPA